MWFHKTNKKIFLIFLLAFALRIYKIESFPPALEWDEVAIGYNSYSILTTAKDEYGIKLPLLFKSFNDYKLPGYIYLDTVFIKLFGLTELAIRLPSVIFGSLAIVPVYFLTQEMIIYFPTSKNKIPKNLPLFCAFFLAISPWHIQFSRAAFEANTALTVMLFGMLCLLLGIRNKLAAVASVPILTLSTYFYYSQRLIVPLIATGFFIIFTNKVKSSFKFYLYGIVISVLLFFPIAVKIIQPEGLKRVSEVSILSDKTIYSEAVSASQQNKNLPTSIFLNYKIPLVFQFLHNYFSYFSPGFLFFGDDPNPRQKVPLTGNLYLFEIPTLMVGIWILLKSSGLKPKSFLILLLLASPLAASLAKESPHSLRALPLVIPLTIISGLGLQRLLSINYLKIPVVTIILVSITGYLVNYYYLYPFQSSKPWGYGYKQLYMKLNQKQESFDKIIVSGEYWKPYIYYLFYNRIDPTQYQKAGNNNNTEKYIFGPTSWDADGRSTDENFIDAHTGKKTLLAISPHEYENLKDKNRFHKLENIQDYSGRDILFEIGQWQ